MRPFAKAALLLATLALGDAAASALAQPHDSWRSCCGMNRWPMGPGNQAMPRHHVAMMWGIPAPYTLLSNPLPRTRATVDRGAGVYAQNCAACHGETGRGDGAAGRDLKPPPGNLAWLSQMPMVRWDPFMYWTVAEGGAPLGTAMPSFKDSLSKDDIWAVIAYIQARLPQKSKMR
jgi:mono/diheme cytochrome c family protein